MKLTVMNTSFFTLPLIVLFCLAGLQGCEVLNQGGDCDGNEIDPIEPVIYLRANFSTESMHLFPAVELYDAEKMIITGSIQKEYCSGKLSGYFTYNPTFFPLTMTLVELTSGFYLPQPYQYKFTNKEDELIVILRIKVYLPDKTIYESGEYVRRYNHTSIKTDVNSLKSYIILDFSSNPQWVTVSE